MFFISISREASILTVIFTFGPIVRWFQRHDLRLSCGLTTVVTGLLPDSRCRYGSSCSSSHVCAHRLEERRFQVHDLRQPCGFMIVETGRVLYFRRGNSCWFSSSHVCARRLGNEWF